MNLETIPEHFRKDMDADSEFFLMNFTEQPPCKVLEVGANEEYVANILADKGYDVTGVDLREYLQKEPCNYHRIKGDFCEMPELAGQFDCLIALSCLEHFGLGTYGESKLMWRERVFLDYDAVAIHMAYLALKPGGVFYLTLPFGNKLKVVLPHWRVYDRDSINWRVIHRFVPEICVYFTSGEAVIGDKKYPPKTMVTPEEADAYDGEDPHVTIFMKLRKPKGE